MKKSENSSIPSDYLEGLSQNWKSDLLSGLVVSLMALPMSLGIAIASGFPPVSGIITAIVGGLIVTLLAGSFLTIKGPAGGLSAIVLGAVVTLGKGDLAAGYTYTLAIVVISGLIQMVFGVVRMGSLADFFPASTIHGMLAALGIIMAAKQIHLVFGVNPTAQKPWDLIMEIPKSIQAMNPKITLIGILSLALLIGSAYVPGRFFKLVPAPLLILIIVVPLGQILGLSTIHDYMYNGQNYHIDPSKILINIPENFIDGISLPNFSKLFTMESWEYIAMLSLAGAIESLLSSKAIDKIDPYKRRSNQNRDLFAIGFGNTIAGLLGGLPMISESKRSVINIDNGGKTRWANFFHGLFLILLVLFAVPVISLIPYAALAAMLVYTGARMATPTEFSKSYKIGAEQFLVFIVTLIITMTTNFLIGVTVGVITELIIHLRFGVTIGALFKTNLKLLKSKDKNFEVVFDGPAIFSNYLGVRRVIENIPETSNVTFDFAKATVVDHTFMEHLNAYEERRSVKGGQIAIAGLDYHKHLSDHPLAAKRIVKQAQLDTRQLSIKAYSQTNQYSYDPRMVSNIVKYKDFSFGESTQIKLEENVLKFSYKGFETEISDILVEQGGQTVTKQDFKMTVSYIANLSHLIPEFTLQKEGFIDSLFSISGFNDIDFEDYPNFSFYYLLKGPNELHIRNFFKEDVIRFFEQNKGYHIESKSNVLLIYKKLTLLNMEEIEMMNQFGQKLLNILHNNINQI